MLRQAIERQLQGKEQIQLIQNAQTLSTRYRTQSGTGERLVTSENEALAYAVARMPATFGAVYSSLKHAITSAGCQPDTLLDVGSGTGAASWAADMLLNLKSIICLEREDVMRQIGQTMMYNGPGSLYNAKWMKYDISSGNIPYQADLIIASYVLNEMTSVSQIQTSVKLWDATKEMLLFVEPGTPKGYAILQKVRTKLLECGAYIAAPCMHEGKCPINQDDWCHFSCRVPRSRMHRQLKGGEVPYEDEKYAYLAVTRKECCHANARILRHPQIHKGYLILDVCTRDEIRKITLSKKDGELYKRAKKAKIGDEIQV